MENFSGLVLLLTYLDRRLQIRKIFNDIILEDSADLVNQLPNDGGIPPADALYSRNRNTHYEVSVRTESVYACLGFLPSFL